MADSLKGVDGFFRYVELQEMGMSDDEIEAALKERAMLGFEARTLKVQSVVERAFLQRSADGEAALASMESAPDITQPARRRIEASKVTYKGLVEESKECDKHIEDGKRRIQVSNEIKARLAKVLGEMEEMLKKTPTQLPIVDEIRQIGAAYGSYCSSK